VQGLHGELEAARAGAARIEIKHTGAHRHRGFVRVAEDDGRVAGGGRIDSELGNVVQHLEP
jgi:hypothetical protein